MMESAFDSQGGLAHEVASSDQSNIATKISLKRSIPLVQEEVEEGEDDLATVPPRTCYVANMLERRGHRQLGP